MGVALGVEQSPTRSPTGFGDRETRINSIFGSSTCGLCSLHYTTAGTCPRTHPTLGSALVVQLKKRNHMELQDIGNENIVLSATRTSDTIVIKMKRYRKYTSDAVVHEGQGANRGLIITQDAKPSDQPLLDSAQAGSKPHMQHVFNCWLVNHTNKNSLREKRVLKFWFTNDANHLDRLAVSYSFFRRLMQPKDFPRDYMNFIKKCMKLMQYRPFAMLEELQVEIIALNSSDSLTRNSQENQLQDKAIYKTAE